MKVRGCAFLSSCPIFNFRYLGKNEGGVSETRQTLWRIGGGCRDCHPDSLDQGRKVHHQVSAWVFNISTCHFDYFYSHLATSFWSASPSSWRKSKGSPQPASSCSPNFPYCCSRQCSAGPPSPSLTSLHPSIPFTIYWTASNNSTGSTYCRIILFSCTSVATAKAFIYWKIRFGCLDE